MSFTSHPHDKAPQAAFMRVFAGLVTKMGQGLGQSLGAGFTLLMALAVGLPLLALIYYGFLPDDAGWDHLVDTNLKTYVINSLALMGLVGLISLVIGVGTAWYVAVCDFPGRKWLSWALILPLAAPAYILAYLYTDLLDVAGPVQMALKAGLGLEAPIDLFHIRSLWGAAFMIALGLYPYIYLLARYAFRSDTGVAFLSARSLGHSPLRAFRRVALPMARPAIIAGLMLVLMETLADFGVVDYFAIPTFSTGIYRTWIGLGERVAALKLCGVMLLFVIVLISAEFLSRRGERDQLGRHYGRGLRLSLGPWQRRFATIFCTLPVILGFGLPVMLLLIHSVQGGDALWGRRFLTLVSNSLSVAFIAAILAALIALCLAYQGRRSHSPFVKAGLRLGTLGYALPGILLAIALLGPVGEIDKGLSRWARDNVGWGGGLIFSGTLILLLYAYMIRFVTVAYNSVGAGLSAISPRLDMAARSLGERPIGVLRRIHMPLLRPAIFSAALLVFVDVMRELPATLILRPFNFDTLATRVYQLAGDERLSEASTAALLIVFIGVVPVILLGRIGDTQAR